MVIAPYEATVYTTILVMYCTRGGEGNASYEFEAEDVLRNQTDVRSGSCMGQISLHHNM